MFLRRWEEAFYVFKVDIIFLRNCAKTSINIDYPIKKASHLLIHFCDSSYNGSIKTRHNNMKLKVLISISEVDVTWHNGMDQKFFFSRK